MYSAQIKQSIEKLAQTTSDAFDIIMYRMLDAPEKPSQDDLMAMIMGAKELHESHCMRVMETIKEWPGKSARNILATTPVKEDKKYTDEIEEEMFSKPLKKMPIDKAEQAIDYQSI